MHHTLTGAKRSARHRSRIALASATAVLGTLLTSGLASAATGPDIAVSLALDSPRQWEPNTVLGGPAAAGSRTRGTPPSPLASRCTSPSAISPYPLDLLTRRLQPDVQRNPRRRCARRGRHHRGARPRHRQCRPAMDDHHHQRPRPRRSSYVPLDRWPLRAVAPRGRGSNGHILASGDHRRQPEQRHCHRRKAGRHRLLIGPAPAAAVRWPPAGIDPEWAHCASVGGAVTGTVPPTRGRGSDRHSEEFDEGERPVATRRREEVLASCRRQEPLQPVLVLRDAVGRRQVERGLVPAHRGEEVGTRDEHRELQLGLGGSVRYVHGA